jgi:hypothetical protein
MVEPREQTGGMTPAARHGEPRYLYACRKDRETA